MKYLAILIFLVLLAGCEKENTDYRDKYIGNYNFVIVTEDWSVTYTHFDTTYFDGSIEKNNNSKDRVYIRFGNSRWVSYGNPPQDTCVGTEYPNPVVNQNGSLIYPEWSRFTGAFVNLDSVKLEMASGGHGFGTIKYVYGHKK